MARLVTAGAEWGANDTSGTPPDGLAVGTTTNTSIWNLSPRSGSRMYEAVGAAGVTAEQTWSFTGATATSYFARAYIAIPDVGQKLAPPAHVVLMRFQTAAFTNLCSIRIVSRDGSNNLTVGVYEDAGGTQIGSTSATLTIGQYYRLELQVNIGTGSNDDTVEGHLEGVSLGSTTTANLGTTAPGLLRIGISTNPGTICGYVFDDVALNDSTGSSQTSWPGPGNVVLLIPTSDNAKGTGWTNDAAGTSNLFDAVNNEPPVGIADTTTGSGLHQLRNATSNANVNYDANLTTYSTAGIGSLDTVNVVVPIVATAAPVSTGAKQGTYGIASNPTIVNVALGSGGIAGAFWSGTAAGTYFIGWKWSFGTTTYAPSVTVGTAPVARITQVTSSTRIAMVCAMGLYVDYTPAVPESLIFDSRHVARNSLLRR